MQSTSFLKNIQVNSNPEIAESISMENFHGLPEQLCLDYASNKGDNQLEPLIEVWLRVVDDGV